MGHGRTEDIIFEGKENHFVTIKRLMRYLWVRDEPGLKLRVVLALLFLVGAKVVIVFTPFFYKDAVDQLDVKEGTLIAFPLLAIASYGAARFMAIIFAEMRDFTFVRVSQNALRRIALETFQHIHNLSLSFHLERKTGGMSRAIERGTRSIDFFMRLMLFSILPTLLEIGLVSIIFLEYFGPKYVVLIGTTIVLYISITFFVTEWRLKYRRKMNKEDASANTKAIDSLLNFETVKYFGNEDHEAKRYDGALKSYQGAAIKSQYSLSLLNGGQSLIINAGLVGCMVLTSLDVISGQLSLGDFVLANTLLLQLFIPLGMLGFVYREVKQGLVDMEQMFSILDKKKDVDDIQNAKPLIPGRGEIEFRNVDFYYENGRKVLNNISFKVNEGDTVALVGPSGAGKSTISRILFRFYDIASGLVTINGQNISFVSQKSLRESIGIVPQDTILFNDTIFYNIAYGRPNASYEDIVAAAKLAKVHDFIETLPEGYKTSVGERGLKLSGGEKQRIAIARTILKGPPILLLDEATSALDTGTEREIQASLKTVSRERTTLIIAHRLSTIVDADEILVLDEGEIIERGSHKGLLEKEGVYNKMWFRQQEAKEVQERLKIL
ncbi:MAG: ABCB family ABC transporter ATP-binding protein/permease, partial [Sphingomonadales bacterium]